MLDDLIEFFVDLFDSWNRQRRKTKPCTRFRYTTSTSREDSELEL